MCGIVGIYNLLNNCDVNQKQIEHEVIKNMADVLIHRGPDDEGYYNDHHISLGFRRLSIIDLSSNGNQPFFNEDKSIIVICNGEIYNYKELKDTLIKKGHRFISNCDIEIISHLYEEFGIEFLTKLNGQFAISLFDKRNNSLFLARDQVGIAPLFWTKFDDKLIFASEIKAILKFPGLSEKKEINLNALDQIFTFPSIVSPNTIFKNIFSLQPGHFLRIKNSDVNIIKYWDLNFPREESLSGNLVLNDIIEELNELLNQSVKSRLTADVPVGCYISGGLDSSLISTLARKHIGNNDLHSFAIGFRDKKIDERKYQNIMVNNLGTIHHETIFESENIIEQLRKVIWHAETPLKETYDVCSIALSTNVAKNNMKVILTGEGADEIFAGYLGYGLDSIRFIDFDDNPEELLDRQIRQNLWGDENFYYERNYYEFNENKKYLYSQELNNIFSEFCSTNISPIEKKAILGRHKSHKRSYIDFKLRIADHLLADHGDRVLYANSVEGRYPFLDINLIEFAKKIHPNLLNHNNTEKYVLKKLSENYLPSEIISRKKFAFVAPGSSHLIKNDNGYLLELLNKERIVSEGYFNPDTVDALIKSHKQENFLINQTFDNDLLMIIISFEIFLKEFNF
jgi:asparagine synthase (glutamine-hydrolysing)